MAAHGIDKVSAHGRAHNGENRAQRSERASARAKVRAERREARAAKRQSTPDVPSTPAPTTQPPEPASTSAPSATTSASESTSTSSSESKNFIGDTKGAKIVNFAVQGARTNNVISVFASGEGPNAKKVEASSSEKAAEPASKVDTVA